jgi:hypothetical protein
MVKFQVHQTHTKKYSGDVLAPCSHCSIPIETPCADKHIQKNDLRIALISLTNSKFDQLGLYHEI